MPGGGGALATVHSGKNATCSAPQARRACGCRCGCRHCWRRGPRTGGAQATGDAARCSAAAASPAEAAIPLWQTAANLVAANPFKSVFGVAAPLYAAIFAYECSSPATKDLPLSQRLIHTRVYGQAIAIGATIAVMAVLNAQEKRGGCRTARRRPSQSSRS